MGLQIPIPPELAHLKIDERGYPIPFFVPIIDGKPNFRFVSQEKQMECMEKKLCGICGKKLNRDYQYFVSGPLGAKNGVSSDPPMHRVCAEFSLRACPHLYNQPAQRKTGKHPILDWYVIEDKPEVMLMVKAAGFKKFYEPISKRYLFRYTPKVLFTYMYVNGVLEFFSELPIKQKT